MPPLAVVFVLWSGRAPRATSIRTASWWWLRQAMKHGVPLPLLEKSLLPQSAFGSAPAAHSKKRSARSLLL